jgi:hypothetical protein
MKGIALGEEGGGTIQRACRILDLMDIHLRRREITHDTKQLGKYQQNEKEGEAAEANIDVYIYR